MGVAPLDSMTLTEALARRIIQAATEKATALDIAVVIAVIDAGTHLKAFSRMDGAVLGSIDLAIKKARTAALFEVDSEVVWEYAQPGTPAEVLQLSNGILATFAGGIPLRSDSGELLGAIGVSGGAVPQDREVAAAGAAVLFVPEINSEEMSK
jgi:uncharacterized protein GlcG (DUF336 family)